MRPTHDVPGVGRFREITIWKAIVFGILTLGIYVLVVSYQNSKDVQSNRGEPFGPWQVFFWVGIILSPLMIVLWVFNGVGVKELRQRTAQQDSALWVVALVLGVLVPPIGQIVWAVHFNDTVRSAARVAPVQAVPAQPTTMAS